MVRNTIRKRYDDKFKRKEFTISHVQKQLKISRPTALKLIRELFEEKKIKIIMKKGLEIWYTHE